MAVEMTYNIENTKNILSQIISNDARPIIVLEAGKEERADLYCNIFSTEPCAFCTSFDTFMSNYVYSIERQKELLKYSYIVVDDIKNLRGMSATLKILSTFIDNMSSQSVSVIFMGTNVTYDMREVLHIIGSKIQYIIKVETERN